MSETVSSASQWMRVCSMVIADDTDAIELVGADQVTGLRVKFAVNYCASGTPASTLARIYNLSPSTVQNIVGLASKDPPTINGLGFPSSARIGLRAGYRTDLGSLFTGTIYQLRIGKESNVDTFIDIFAADGDLSHNWATMRVALTKGLHDPGCVSALRQLDAAMADNLRRAAERPAKPASPSGPSAVRDDPRRAERHGRQQQLHLEHLRQRAASAA
jgi:hypothetical protein